MDSISEDDIPLTSSPTPSAISFPASKIPPIPPSPRARPAAPAGPRSRKGTLNSAILTGHANNITNGRRVSLDSVISGRHSPSSSHSGSIHSPILERRPTLQYQTDEKEIQTDSQYSSPTSLTPVPTPTQETTPVCPQTIKVVNKPPTLPFPTPITFAANPIAFRGLTLEAAQWTFTSDELRDIVSHAIRDSAKESFIRLIPLEAVEKEIPAEMERLDTFRAATQAQHRFHFQRRTNILQSLHALSRTMPTPDDGSNPVASFTCQLAEISAAMDRFTETLLHIADERAQMTHVQDVHVSSALAMALRKLNGSYSKRTAELKHARARIEELEAELDEAWKVAQDMAQEIDDLDNFDHDHSLDDETRSGLIVQDEDMTRASAVDAQVLGVTGKAVSSLAVLVSSPVQSSSPTSFTLPPKSSSRPSSSNEGRGDQASKVLAARRRGSLTSRAGLRLPKSGLSSPAASGSESGNTPTTLARRSKNGKSFPDSPDIPPIPSSSFLELSRPVSPQSSSIDDPPVPTFTRVSQPEHDRAEHEEERHSDGVADNTGLQSKTFYVHESTFANRSVDEFGEPTLGFDRTFIPSLSSELGTPVGRPSSVDETLLGHSSITPYDSKTRRIQSMLPPSLSSVDRGTTQLEQDSPIVPGVKMPSFLNALPLRGVESEIKRLTKEPNSKPDRWPWSSSKHLVPTHPPSPTPSFVPSLALPPEEKLERIRRSAPRLQSKRRRNSVPVPLPSAALAALLPTGRKVVDKIPSEPSFTSQGPRSSISF